MFTSFKELDLVDAARGRTGPPDPSCSLRPGFSLRGAEPRTPEEIAASRALGEVLRTKDRRVPKMPPSLLAMNEAAARRLRPRKRRLLDILESQPLASPFVRCRKRRLRDADEMCTSDTTDSAESSTEVVPDEGFDLGMECIAGAWAPPSPAPPEDRPGMDPWEAVRLLDRAGSRFRKRFARKTRRRIQTAVQFGDMAGWQIEP